MKFKNTCQVQFLTLPCMDMLALGYLCDARASFCRDVMSEAVGEDMCLSLLFATAIFTPDFNSVFCFKFAYESRIPGLWISL